MKTQHKATFFAVLAATLYAINIPIGKLLLGKVEPVMMAALLYLGAGFGLLICKMLSGKKDRESTLTKAELPYTIGMVALDIAAPILLMLGLRGIHSANASLLNNFEIVATSLLAFFFFREKLSKHLVLAIVLVTLASVTLSFEGAGALSFCGGSLLVLAAACCWGLENNCTRMLSNKSSMQITIIKGVFSGLGSLIVALVKREALPGFLWAMAVMLLGFVAYGLSINFYIKAQKDLGAAKTSAYYAISPFLGVIFSFLVLREKPGVQFYLGFLLMVIATVLLIKDTITLQHTHEHTHTHCHAHRHGEMVHNHEHTHVHNHAHIHGVKENAHGHEHKVLDGHDHIHT